MITKALYLSVAKGKQMCHKVGRDPQNVRPRASKGEAIDTVKFRQIHELLVEFFDKRGMDYALIGAFAL
ncbi:hypothetical protein EDC27_1542 [Desulfosoma caldarium]|uniref:Uncharacterized protein n=1 Tax=Desulfosoma caldarium TaxID=610254 RepID=A0A3N1UVT2_9BACT|nr:hypothetical protein EDC27_1542 [Desulfosoma caldarium]